MTEEMGQEAEYQVLAREEIAALLESPQHHRRLEAMAHLLAGDAPAAPFAARLAELQKSAEPAPGGMTEGQVAALVMNTLAR